MFKKSILSLTLVFSFSTFALEKPEVMIFATGGTIAGSAQKATDITGYSAGEIAVSTLIEAVPEIADVADVKGIQVANTSSSNISNEILLELGREAKVALNGEAKGVIVTHGTDTAEETAFFLDLVNQTDKPIVVVGAMRPATAISADGPMNLLNAVTLATSDEAKGRGTMIMLNDFIGSAYYTSKTNSTSLDTFKAYDQGFLGTFAGGVPKFYFDAAQATGKPSFDISKIETLPQVDIIYSYLGMQADQLDALVASGSKGIVVAGSGNGSTPQAVRDRIAELQKKGIPVVLSSRTGTGYVTSKEHGIASGTLNPQKARIMLMLGLTKTQDLDELAALFGTDV
ncbi:L-asparaginase [Psychromonas sp. psych-6C06]|uniref:asparaginase n=1 Tax=Psychromonas sp. psych-6C06 TaxID=2058089 RepID=UPI000C32B842|nr:asparaginase [Psychromonas sp. psych-6C06]PKF60197.1 L-asparaginase [Psychromonas sp. psych-6C06]